MASQSPNLNPAVHLWDLQQMRDGIMSKWTNISKEGFYVGFQHLAKSNP